MNPTTLTLEEVLQTARRHGGQITLAANFSPPGPPGTYWGIYRHPTQEGRLSAYTHLEDEPRGALYDYHYLGAIIPNGPTALPTWEPYVAPSAPSAPSAPLTVDLGYEEALVDIEEVREAFAGRAHRPLAAGQHYAVMDWTDTYGDMAFRERPFSTHRLVGYYRPPTHPMGESWLPVMAPVIEEVRSST